VAAKHDNKHARANMWVTHQNLAAQKGGRPGYQFKERKAPIVPKRASTEPAAVKPADDVTAAPAASEAPESAP